jgi:periplasmic protein CpxP/Spy
VQQQQIQTLIQQRSEGQREVVSRLREALESRRKAIEAMPFDETAIRSTTQTLVDAQTELAVLRAKLRSDIFALLTPEQQAQAVKLADERAARQSHRRERPRLGTPRQQQD